MLLRLCKLIQIYINIFNLYNQIFDVKNSCWTSACLLWVENWDPLGDESVLRFFVSKSLLQDLNPWSPVKKTKNKPTKPCFFIFANFANFTNINIFKLYNQIFDVKNSSWTSAHLLWVENWDPFGDESVPRCFVSKSLLQDLNPWFPIKMTKTVTN